MATQSASAKKSKKQKSRRIRSIIYTVLVVIIVFTLVRYLLLRPSGALMVEINESLGLSVKGLFEGYGFRDVLIIKDFFGKDRFVKCIL